ncbi:amidase family protein [Spirillospora sp. NPDC048911]|uniref:amidase family protein n=1 Tax=Spirillospora sp. NPDC048911 TaxID=3364527 RepID=UPI003716B138
MDVLLAIITCPVSGLVTVGMAVTFAATRVVNLAQGDLVMVGAYTAAVVTGPAFGWRVTLALAGAAPLLVLVERLLLRRPLADPLATMLVTWGVGMALRQVAELQFTSTARSVESPVAGTVTVLTAPYPAYRLVCGLVAVAVIGLVLLAAYRTGWGLTLRAHSGIYTRAAALLQTESVQVRAQWGRDFDVLLTPTLACPPPRSGACLAEANANPGGFRLTEVQMISFTSVCNISGLPAVSLPVHTSAEGLPIGAHLIGGPWDEAVLVRLASALEELDGWPGRRPPHLT